MLRTAIRDVTKPAHRAPASIGDLPIGQAIALAEIYSAALLQEHKRQNIFPGRKVAGVQRLIERLRRAAPQTQLQQFAEDRYALVMLGLALKDPLLGLQPTDK